ncbi:MAG: GFA family protein [Burkholderiaceae bacterium]
MTQQHPDNRPVHQAACHCGAVRFTLKLSDGVRGARRCNCSYCRMRGAVAVSANLGDLKVQQGQDALSLYQFKTGVAKHYFCSKCGIYTFHQRRSLPNEYGVNVACIEGMSPFDFKEIPVSEGRVHPMDHPDRASVVAGWLRYETNPDADFHHA